MLQNALNFYYEQLSDMAQAPLEVNQNTFTTDRALNQTRDFLVRCIKNKSLAPKSVEICFKLIIRIGIARANPEDFLLAIDLLNKNPTLAQKVDLRAELTSLRVSTGAAGSKSQAQNLLSEVNQKGSFNRILLSLDSYMVS